MASDTSTNWRWKNRLHPTPCILTRRKLQLRIVSILSHGGFFSQIQWLFLVPLIGGRYHIIPQLAVYTFILPIGWLYGTYHLLREPGNSIDKWIWVPQVLSRSRVDEEKFSMFTDTWFFVGDHDADGIPISKNLFCIQYCFAPLWIIWNSFSFTWIMMFFNFMLGGDSSQTKIWDFTWLNNMP